YFGFEFPGGEFGELQFEAVAGVWDVDHADITLADIFDADTEVSIDGDFTAATDITWNGISADDRNGLHAWFEFATVDPGNDGPLVYVENAGEPIASSTYSATLHTSTNTGYETTDRTTDVGEIIRNGTQLQAPLVQIPQDWISRVALTNTGGVDRPYEMNVMTETGIVATLADSTGTVPAGGTVVLDLPGNLSFDDGARGTINVNVSAPNNQIQGLYQIVNPSKGSISNHVMVRPGTN
ncbi:MAG: hypothetical protein M3Y70_02875, partial [Pseudomonadota bacterium]|nr:hypothetical protein [Pseudomonadota bacterium]